MCRFTPGSGAARDKFKECASFDLVVALYEFDEMLRHSVFTELDRIEMAIRTTLGYELGRVDPLVHFDVDLLGTRAHQRDRRGRSVHEVWLTKYRAALRTSKEEFVSHHKDLVDRRRPAQKVIESSRTSPIPEIARLDMCLAFSLNASPSWAQETERSVNRPTEVSLRSSYGYYPGGMNAEEGKFCGQPWNWGKCSSAKSTADDALARAKKKIDASTLYLVKVMHIDIATGALE